MAQKRRSRSRAAKKTPHNDSPVSANATRAPMTPAAPSSSVVVGIGASAGGLEALKALLAAVPNDSGVTFVVVVHLDPTHESFMPELIARGTSLHVEAARDRQPMLPNNVYIIPPNRHLTIEQGLIRL